MVVWLNVYDAQRYIGRSPRTLHRWRTTGIVKVGKAKGEWYWDKDSLKVARKEAKRRQWESEGKAGPGRGRVDSTPDDGVLF